jgi:hypothetical protein
MFCTIRSVPNMHSIPCSVFPVPIHAFSIPHKARQGKTRQDKTRQDNIQDKRREHETECIQKGRLAFHWLDIGCFSLAGYWVHIIGWILGAFHWLDIVCSNPYMKMPFSTHATTTTTTKQANTGILNCFQRIVSISRKDPNFNQVSNFFQ